MVVTSSGQCPQRPPVTDSGLSALRGEDEGFAFEFLEFPHPCAWVRLRQGMRLVRDTTSIH